jgi:hypothetical protein
MSPCATDATRALPTKERELTGILSSIRRGRAGAGGTILAMERDDYPNA